MKIFDAYDKSSIRLNFKDYIEAEGVSMSKREQIYIRFGTYISRIRFFPILVERLFFSIYLVAWNAIFLKIKIGMVAPTTRQNRRAQHIIPL